MSIKKVILFSLFLSGIIRLNAQHEVIPEEGFSTQIGIMVDMLDEMKDRIAEDVKDLNQEQTDFMFDDKANSIGAILMHLIANESYYQVETLEGRTWTEEERARYETAGGLGPESQGAFTGKPAQYYLDLWDEVRAKTLEGLKKKDDAWFAAQVDEGVNNHWVWFHVLEHSASHMGQISLVKARLPE